MRRIILFLTAFTLGTAGGATAAPGDGRQQALAAVDRELHLYVRGVEPSDLSTHQLVAIRSVMHSPLSHSDKRLRIKSIIGGPYSLRSLFFN